MKCEACGARLGETFLNKPLGTLVKDERGKGHWLCSKCQRGKGKEELLAAIKK